MIDFLRNLPFKTYTGLFLCSLFFSYWLVPRVAWLARGFGVFARTASEKGHPTPSLGGLAVGIPFLTGISLLLLLKNQVSENMYMIPLQMRGLFFGSCLILTLGFIQDLLSLNWYLRCALQSAVAAMAYHYGFRLETLPVPNLGLFSLGLSFPLTILWIVGLINLFDLFNRLNDSFARLSLLPILSLLMVAFLLAQYRTIVVCCLLSGGLLGILSYDFSPLRANLGSTGTFFLGFVLAVTVLQSYMKDSHGLPLLVLGISLLILLLGIKIPARMSSFPARTPDLRLRIRSLHHFKQAIALKMEAAADPDENWRSLCQAAQEFGCHRLSHRSNTGEVIKEWNAPSRREDEATQKLAFDLKHSGGTLIAKGPLSDADQIGLERESLFMDLTALFDRKLEDAIVSHVDQRQNRLHVLLVNRYFSGMSATGQILEDLAEDLTEAGVAVTVLTGRPGYEDPSPLPGRNELRKGVHIYRVPATHFGRDNHLNRTMDFIFFYLFSMAWILKVASHQYTHIMTFTDPPLIGIVGYAARRLKGWKFIYNIQDLYPETALALGILKKGCIFRLCNRINTTLLREADAIVAIGQNMASHIRSIGDFPKRIEVIPNWADGRKILPIDRMQNPLRKSLKLEDVYTVIYAGNMGLAQEIDVLIQIVKTFKDRRDIQFLFMGGGVRRVNLEEAVSKHHLTNVKFIDYQPRADLSPYLRLGDIGIVTLSPKLEGLAIPTKTYSYLAAGMPILAISGKDSELKTLADQGLGTHFDPDSVEKIVEFLESEIRQRRRYDAHPIRNYFEAHFDRPLQTQRYLALLESLR